MRIHHGTARRRDGRRRVRSRAALAAAGFVLAGCAGGETVGGVSDTDAVGPELTSASESADSAGAAGDAGGDGLPGGEGVAINFTVLDHDYEGLPERVATGSQLTMQTTDEGEFHQVAVYRLDDDETRTVDQLAALPLDTDAPDAIGNGKLDGLSATAIGGLSAPVGGYPGRMFSGPRPGGFSIELAEPGRYLVIGTLPVGTAEVDAVIAENSGDYSQVQDPPYHYQEGEIAVVEVVDD